MISIANAHSSTPRLAFDAMVLAVLLLGIPALSMALPVDTPVPTPTRIPSDAIELEARVGNGAPGEQVQLQVVLHTRGNLVAGVEVVVTAAAPLRITGCRGNPSIGKDFTRFALREDGVKAIVISLTNVSPIRDGSVLFGCDVEIAPDAEPGTHSLQLENVFAATPPGHPLDGIASGGTMSVTEPPSRNVDVETDGSATMASGCEIDATPGRGAWFPLLAGVFVAWGRSRTRRRTRATV